MTFGVQRSAFAGVAARVTGRVALRVALLRDRRCTSENLPLLTRPPQPFILRSLILPVHVL